MMNQDDWAAQKQEFARSEAAAESAAYEAEMLADREMIYAVEATKLRKALASGESPALVRDALGEDEMIPDAVKARLYALLDEEGATPEALPETIAATPERVRAALEDGGKVELTVRSKATGEHVYVTLIARKRKPGGGYYARNTEAGRVGLGEADRVEVRDTNLDWPECRVGAYLPAKGRFYGDDGVDPARLWAGRNVFAWALGGHDLSALADVFVATRCARCSRKLKHPESVERMIGPECASKILKGKQASYAKNVQTKMEVAA